MSHAYLTHTGAGFVVDRIVEDDEVDPGCCNKCGHMMDIPFDHEPTDTCHACDLAELDQLQPEPQSGSEE